MRKIVSFLFIFICLGFNVSFAKEGASGIRSANDTASGIPAVPYRAVINQQNAQVYAQCLAKIIVSIEGEKVLVIPFPKGAQDIRMNLPEHNGKSQGQITSWIMEKALPFKPQGAIEKQRITFESMHDSLNGALTNLYAQKEALLESIKDKNSATVQKNAEKISPTLALIGTRIAATERALAEARSRAEQFADSLPMSQQYVVRINSELPVDTEVLVDYAYTLSNTFWSPEYVIDANSHDNTINVKLFANVTQNSDIDWLSVDLELTTNQGNERGPAPLNPWVVRQSSQGMVYAKSRMEAAPMMLTSNAGSASDAMPSFSEGTTLASWKINDFAKLAEGNTMIELSEDTLKSPLLRIARPAVSDNKVWLSAKHMVQSSFYPAGEALYLLDGVVTGKGVFAPKAGETQLFFGADPLVTVETKQKQRKSAEKGIIDKEQAWTWTWVYEVENKRSAAVDVRIEEAQTQVEDAAMSVSYADEPAPKTGPEKTFLWDVQTPAKGKSIIKRSITVKAPKDMKLNLGR